MQTEQVQRTGSDCKSSTNSREIVQQCFDRVIEVYKARLTVALFLGLATVTLTGYALQNKQFYIFYLAAVIPQLSLVLDLALKHYLAAPFLYKAFTTDFQAAEYNSEILLFLEFPLKSPSQFASVFDQPTEAKRQESFRRLYVWRSIIPRLLLFGIASGVEIGLATLLPDSATNLPNNALHQPLDPVHLALPLQAVCVKFV